MKMNKKLTKEYIALKTKNDKIQSIKQINLWGSELDDVSLLQKMPELEVISLSINKIKTLKAFENMQHLKELYLRNNLITDIKELKYLSTCPNLKVLWLSENPISKSRVYRSNVLRILPNLTKLDNIIVSENEKTRYSNEEEEDRALIEEEACDKFLDDDYLIKDNYRSDSANKQKPIVKKKHHDYYEENKYKLFNNYKDYDKDNDYDKRKERHFNKGYEYLERDKRNSRKKMFDFFTKNEYNIDHHNYHNDDNYDNYNYWRFDYDSHNKYNDHKHQGKRKAYNQSQFNNQMNHCPQIYQFNNQHCRCCVRKIISNANQRKQYPKIIKSIMMLFKELTPNEVLFLQKEINRKLN